MKAQLAQVLLPPASASGFRPSTLMCCFRVSFVREGGGSYGFGASCGMLRNMHVADVYARC